MTTSIGGATGGVIAVVVVTGEVDVVCGDVVVVAAGASVTVDAGELVGDGVDGAEEVGVSPPPLVQPATTAMHTQNRQRRRISITPSRQDSSCSPPVPGPSGPRVPLAVATRDITRETDSRTPAEILCDGSWRFETLLGERL